MESKITIKLTARNIIYDYKGSQVVYDKASRSYQYLIDYQGCSGKTEYHKHIIAEMQLSVEGNETKRVQE